MGPSPSQAVSSASLDVFEVQVVLESRLIRSGASPNRAQGARYVSFCPFSSMPGDGDDAQVVKLQMHLLDDRLDSHMDSPNSYLGN